MTSTWLRSAFRLSMAAMLVSGCWNVCDSGQYHTVFECRQSGTVEVTITPPLQLSSTPEVIYVATCHGIGGCQEPPWFAVGNSYRGPGDEVLDVSVELPAGVAAGTITLPSPDVSVMANLRRIAQDPPDVVRTLNVVSGTITVESSTELRFAATFEIVLETEDGQRVSLTQGRASADDCKLREVCSGG